MLGKRSKRFANLVKKAVGLPTGASSCCDAPAVRGSADSACCGGEAPASSNRAKNHASCDCGEPMIWQKLCVLPQTRPTPLPGT